MTKADEMALEWGLNIREHPCRWQQAQDMALRMQKREYPETSAIDLAFRLFVELGGADKGQYILR